MSVKDSQGFTFHRTCNWSTANYRYKRNLYFSVSKIIRALKLPLNKIWINYFYFSNSISTELFISTADILSTFSVCRNPVNVHCLQTSCQRSMSADILSTFTACRHHVNVQCLQASCQRSLSADIMSTFTVCRQYHHSRIPALHHGTASWFHYSCYIYDYKWWESLVGEKWLEFPVHVGEITFSNLTQPTGDLSGISVRLS